MSLFAASPVILALLVTFSLSIFMWLKASFLGFVTPVGFVVSISSILTFSDIFKEPLIKVVSSLWLAVLLIFIPPA